AWCFRRCKDELHGRGIVGAPLVQLLQTLEPVTRTRMLIAHTRQLRFRVANRFVTTNDSIDRHFTFCLQLRNTRPRIAELACILLSFNLSLRVLARGTIALARKAFGLLRQTFERCFELPCDLAHSLGNRSL